MSNSKKYVVDTDFIEEACKLNLSLQEFLLLLYFINADDLTFDLERISNKLKIKKEDILNAFNSLLSKQIISLISDKNELGKRIDKICLDGFYNIIEEDKLKEKKKKMKEDIFTIFQNKFQRPLRSIEIETIKVWIEKMYNEEIVLTALEEAEYNGALNTKYIDTILYEWNKKGLKTKEDVENYMKNRSNENNRKLEETSIWDLDWLDDYDKL